MSAEILHECYLLYFTLHPFPYARRIFFGLGRILACYHAMLYSAKAANDQRGNCFSLHALTPLNHKVK